MLGSAAAHTPAVWPEAKPDIVQIDETPDRAAVKKALAKRRAKNIAAFRAYRKAGVYVRNTVRVGPLNVWIDGDGRLCAAATMISKDGKHQLVLDTGRDNNFIRLLNVTEGPLLDWMLTSGLTIEEIDRIQVPPMMPDEYMRKIDWSAEDARLTKLYLQVEAALSKNAKKSLEIAVDRLMKHPALAKKLVAGTL